MHGHVWSKKAHTICWTSFSYNICCDGSHYAHSRGGAYHPCDCYRLNRIYLYDVDGNRYHTDDACDGVYTQNQAKKTFLLAISMLFSLCAPCCLSRQVWVCLLPVLSHPLNEVESSEHYGPFLWHWLSPFLFIGAQMLDDSPSLLNFISTHDCTEFQVRIFWQDM